MPLMSAPKRPAAAFTSAAAAAGESKLRRSAATGPVKRGSCSSRIRRRYSSTASIRIERPPTFAYQWSHANAGGGLDKRLPLHALVGASRRHVLEFVHASARPRDDQPIDTVAPPDAERHRQL